MQRKAEDENIAAPVETPKSRPATLSAKASTFSPAENATIEKKSSEKELFSLMTEYINAGEACGFFKKDITKRIKILLKEKRFESTIHFGDLWHIIYSEPLNQWSNNQRLAIKLSCSLLDLMTSLLPPSLIAKYGLERRPLPLSPIPIPIRKSTPAHYTQPEYKNLYSLFGPRLMLNKDTEEKKPSQTLSPIF